MTTLPPVVRTIEVACDPRRAFELWTDDIAGWWPMATHSVCGADATVAFEGDRLVEAGPDGTEHPWGTVTVWEPPQRLALTWHPGRDASEGTHVEVRFEAVQPGRTLVTLTHTGWEARAESAQVRQNYEDGWAVVLDTLAGAQAL